MEENSPCEGHHIRVQIARQRLEYSVIRKKYKTIQALMVFLFLSVCFVIYSREEKPQVEPIIEKKRHNTWDDPVLERFLRSLGQVQYLSSKVYANHSFTPEAKLVLVELRFQDFMSWVHRVAFELEDDSTIPSFEGRHSAGLSLFDYFAEGLSQLQYLMAMGTSSRFECVRQALRSDQYSSVRLGRACLQSLNLLASTKDYIEKVAYVMADWARIEGERAVIQDFFAKTREAFVNRKMRRAHEIIRALDALEKQLGIDS